MCLVNAVCLVTRSSSKTPEQLYESKAYLLNSLKSSIRVPPVGLVIVVEPHTIKRLRWVVTL